MGSVCLFFLHLLLFVLIFLLLFYPLGYLILRNVSKNLEGYEIITLSFAVSIVVFVLLSVFLTLIGARFLLVFILVGVNVFSVVKYKKKLLIPWLSFSKNTLLLILIFLGILVQGFISFPSGYQYPNGFLFWSSQGFDGLWHIALMEAIKKGIPPQMPLFAGAKLQNYHYLVDILMGEFNYIFGFFSSLDLYFRFFPLLFSFLMGLSVFSFVARWKSKTVGYWALFFIFFTGSFGFLLTYFRSGRIFGGETAFWVSQLNTIIANPPHASAIILLCAFLLAFLFFVKTVSGEWFLICFLIGSLVSGFKVSGGALLLVGLGVASFFRILKEKKFDFFSLFLSLLATNIITLKLVSPNAESYLIFEPWWFIRTMVVDKLGLIDWELRRQTYLSVGRFTSYLRVLQLEGTAFLIFLIGNLGTRILSFPVVGRKIIHFKKEIFESSIDAFLISAAMAGFLIPMLFLQKGIVYNSIQFMQYTLLITGFYGAVFIALTLKKITSSLGRYVIVIGLIALSTPTVIGNFVEFYGGPPTAKISNEEISALTYLKDNSSPDDIILTRPFDIGDKYNYRQNPLPIYAWSGTAYVTALTGRETYLSCEEMLRQTGYDVDGRLDEENKFFSQKDFEFNRDFLKKRGIKYVYLPRQANYSLNEENNSLKKVFSNSEVDLFKVE